MAIAEEIGGLILALILLKLSLKMVVLCGGVCREWRRVAFEQNPYDSLDHFIHFHPARSMLRLLSVQDMRNPILTLDLTQTTALRNRMFFLGPTVNGLVMLKDMEGYGRVGSGLILNPITMDYIDFPGPLRELHQKVIFGMGVDAAGNTKVIRVTQHNRSDVHADVFTLGTGEWRTLPVCPFVLDEIHPFGVFFKERSHFYTVGPRHPLSVFDFNSHQFLPFPSIGIEIPDTLPPHGVVLSVLNEKLCQTICTYESIFIWTMNEYGIGTSWQRYLTIDRSVNFPSQDPFIVDDFEVFLSTADRFLIRRDSGHLSVYYPPPNGRRTYSIDYFHCGGEWEATCFHPSTTLLAEIEPTRAGKLGV